MVKGSTDSTTFVPLVTTERGARIQVVAPSSPFDEGKLKKGQKRLEREGFSFIGNPCPLRPTHRFLNGSDRERRQELNEAFRSEAEIVWMARGGYGLTRLEGQLKDEWNRSGPICVGFSDVTALLGALYNANRPCLHGPLITTLDGESEESVSHLLGLLGGTGTIKTVFDLEWMEGPRTGALGRLFAGNLCVLTHLIGTSWFPTLDGAILCIEEVGERPYRIDRMLTQLVHSGSLEGVRAVIVGTLQGCEENPTGDSTALTALEVIQERLSGLNIPICSGLPFGHGQPNFALPVGALVELQDDPCQLRLRGYPSS